MDWLTRHAGWILLAGFIWTIAALSEMIREFRAVSSWLGDINRAQQTQHYLMQHMAQTLGEIRTALARERSPFTPRDPD